MSSESTPIELHLSAPLRGFVDHQAAANGFATAAEYVQSLVSEAQQSLFRRELEAKVLEGLRSGEPREWTQADWDKLKSQIVNRSSAGSNG